MSLHTKYYPLANTLLIFGRDAIATEPAAQEAIYKRPQSPRRRCVPGVPTDDRQPTWIASVWEQSCRERDSDAADRQKVRQGQVWWLNSD